VARQRGRSFVQPSVADARHSFTSIAASACGAPPAAVAGRDAVGTALPWASCPSCERCRHWTSPLAPAAAVLSADAGGVSSERQGPRAAPSGQYLRLPWTWPPHPT